MKTQHGKEIDEEYQRHLKEKQDIYRDYTLQLTTLREEMINCNQLCQKDKEEAAVEFEAKIARLTKELSEYDSRMHCERLIARALGCKSTKPREQTRGREATQRERERVSET